MAFINGSNIEKKNTMSPCVNERCIYRTRKLVEKGWKNPKLLENGFSAIHPHMLVKALRSKKMKCRAWQDL